MLAAVDAQDDHEEVDDRQDIALDYGCWVTLIKVLISRFTLRHFNYYKIIIILLKMVELKTIRGQPTEF